MTLPDPKRFALAGRAVFTVESKKTGTRYTYRVRRAPETGDAAASRLASAPCWFVGVLSGPDNTSHYGYLGFIRNGVFKHGGSKARIAADAPSARAFDWYWRNIDNGALAQVDVHHEGHCGRCGRALTVPSSVLSGFGPECINYV
jgi:hypothetical protein